MKNLVTTVLFLLATMPLLAQTQDDLFDDSIVHEIRFEVRPSDWTQLKQDFLFNTYYPANFIWKFKGRDVLVRDVGIRSRGRGSRSPVKPNLRVDFNRFEPGRALLGLSSLVLKANNQDASMLRDKSVFKLWARTGLPSSREAYAKVFINSDYLGLFVITEELRSEYLKRYLGEGDGDLYEWKPIENFHFEWRPTCAGAQLGCSTNTDRWQPTPLDPQENKLTFDIAPTIDFFRQVNQVSDADFERVVSGLTDLRLWLLHNALETYVADFDSILGDVFGANNFWMYRYEKSNFHQFLPWDKDGAFDSSKRPLFANAEQNVLMRRTLALPGRRNQYLEAIYKTAVLAGGLGGWMEANHASDYTLMRQAALDDKYKQYAHDGIVGASSNALFESNTLTNRQFLVERWSFVIAELAANGLRLPASLAVAQGGVVNAATNAAGPIAPGSGVSIYGSGFTDQTRSAPGAPLPTTLAGVSVYVNGFAAPLLFVSPNQINIQVPWELGVGDGTAPFTVSIDGPAIRGTRPDSPVSATFSNTVSSRVNLFAPGVYVALQGATGRPVSAEPARSGDVLVVYAAGLGPVTVPVATGRLAPLDVLSYTVETPIVTIDGQRAELLFSGLTPGTAGVYQINLRVPADVRAGGVPLVIAVGGQSSPAVTLPTR